MPEYQLHEKALHSSIRARILIGLVFIAVLGLAVWGFLYR